MRIARQTRPEQVEWHSMSEAQVLSRLGADIEEGLSAPEVRRRLDRYGHNVLREVRVRSAWAIFVSQFRNLPTLLLLGATITSLSMGRVLEAASVLAVIILTAILGFFTEHRAQQAMEALKRLGAPRAKALRDDLLSEVPAEDLVPGDIIEMEAGDRVPADARLVEAAGFLVEEAELTGESVGVDKDPDVVVPPDAPLGDRRNMVYLGTMVLEGRAAGIVVATGMDTEAGHIGQLVEEVGEEITPLEKRLGQLGRYLIIAVLVLAAFYIGVGILLGEERSRLLITGVVLAVAAVPEGLPAVATIALALGMRRMARRHALIRRLPAVETLGSVTVICTDKTGTLTLNQMTLREIRIGSRIVTLSGEGYEPHGHFLRDSHRIDPTRDGNLASLLRVGALCNDAELGEERLDDSVAWKVVGDPTEGALLVAAAKAGLDRHVLEEEYPRLEEIPFDPRLKRMTTIHRAPAPPLRGVRSHLPMSEDRTKPSEAAKVSPAKRDSDTFSSVECRKEPEGNVLAFVKGAPETILANSGFVLTDEGVRELLPADRERIIRQNDEMARKALRVLAIAYRELPPRWTVDEAKMGLTFLGLVGFLDPPRAEVKEAIRHCNEAGIRVVMVTGDQPATALAVAQELSLTEDGFEVIDDKELSRLTPAQLAEIAGKVAVFARVSPEHKLVIVRAFQKAGHIVAMTGDGVNDAPALKRADIGIAMGRRGTDVAREAADMVLADDNFATIVAAVEEGRVIYANIKKFVQYLFACNLSEIFTMLIAVLVGLPIPLLPLQILWINLTVNTFPALALAGEPGEARAMLSAPTPPRESLLPRSAQVRIIGISFLLALTALGAFLWALSVYGEGRHAETIAFVTLAMAQLWLAFSARASEVSILSLGLTTNPYMLGAAVVTSLSIIAAVYLPGLETVLESAALLPNDWAVLLGFSILPVAFDELWKLVRRRKLA